MIDYVNPRATAETRMGALRVGAVFMFRDDGRMPQTWVKLGVNMFRVTYDTIVFSFGWGPGVAFGPSSVAWMDARDLVVLDFVEDVGEVR